MYPVDAQAKNITINYSAFLQSPIILAHDVSILRHESSELALALFGFQRLQDFSGAALFSDAVHEFLESPESLNKEPS